MAEEFAKTLERYDVVDRIAVGGMAEVFLAKAYGAHGFEKTLAIKRILPDLARDPEFEQRFIAEAKVAVRLSHTNIVQVMDFGRFAESLFIAMEYVDGLDLAALLRRYKELKLRVPIAAAFQIAIEIARGLDYAHQHGVVHRDVSPSNILLSRAGEVKIADFGIAVAARRHSPNAPGPAAGTGTRKVMGKWRYMSPEQARGEQLDTRSDLFSAASVMYELFTGEKLFPGDEAEDIIKNIHDMPLPRPSRVREGLPPRLDEILHTALARRPTDRPARAAVMLRALTELSYESSIVCTTIDVSEAVGIVLPEGQAGASVVDELIRKQLAGHTNVGRETAVTDGKKRQTLVTNNAPTSEERPAGKPAGIDTTGVFRHKIDLDGISRLEVDPTTLAAQPRARRASSQPPPANHPTGESPVLTGLGATLAATGDVTRDPDRRTEVGPPLAESRPFFKVDPDDKDKTRGAQKISAEDAASSSVPRMTTIETTTGTGPSRPPSRRMWLVVGALAIIGGGVAAFALTRGPSEKDTPVATTTPDAAPAPPAAKGTLDLTSDPPGALVFVNGDPSGQTPTKFEVPAGQRAFVRMTLAGREDCAPNAIVVKAGATEPVHCKLIARGARLRVRSTPDSATVRLDGINLGPTPLDRDGLTPAKSAVLEVIRPGFTPVKEKITLEAGVTTEKKYVLVQGERFGRVVIGIAADKGGWADVYFQGKKISSGLSQHTIRLPVGTQVVKLVNPTTKKQAMLRVEVSETKVNPYPNIELK